MKSTTLKHLSLSIPSIFLAVILAFGTLATPAYADTPLQATCASIPHNGLTNQAVNWQAQGVTGGNGTYSYYWSGTDGLTGSDKTITKSYTYPGSKTASLSITSGGQVFNTTCSTYVAPSDGTVYTGNYPYNTYPYNNGNLQVSCYATPANANMGDTVTWVTNVSGGNGSYTYSWTGTDGLSGSGQTVYKSYSNPGPKTATVTVYAGGIAASQTCSMNVGSTYYGNNNYYPPYNGQTYTPTYPTYPYNNQYYPNYNDQYYYNNYGSSYYSGSYNYGTGFQSNYSYPYYPYNNQFYNGSQYNYGGGFIKTSEGSSYGTGYSTPYYGGAGYQYPQSGGFIRTS
jgi:hypothetical protein